MITHNYNIGSNSNYRRQASKLKKNPKSKLNDAGMYEMKEVYSEFIEYLENLDTTIQKALERNKTLMKGRYLSAAQHLEKMKKNVINYEEKMLNLQKELNEDESIYNIVKQIDNFQVFYKILKEKMNELDSVIQSKEEESELLLEKMREKKNLVLKVHQENIKFSTKILSFKMEFPFLKEKTISDEFKLDEKKDKKVKSSLLDIKKIQKDYTSLKYELENIDLENHALKSELSKRSNRFIQSKRLFRESLNALNKTLLLQEKVTNQTGLKNSLLFKIKQAPSSAEPRISKSLRMGSRDEKSMLQDRQITNVVYSTLQKIVKDKKNRKQNFLEKINLKWEDFNSFTPLQIMGLISMKFDNNSWLLKEFDEKEKKINIFFSKIKIF